MSYLLKNKYYNLRLAVVTSLNIRIHLDFRHDDPYS